MRRLDRKEERVAREIGDIVGGDFDARWVGDKTLGLLPCGERGLMRGRRVRRRIDGIGVEGLPAHHIGNVPRPCSTRSLPSAARVATARRTEWCPVSKARHSCASVGSCSPVARRPSAISAESRSRMIFQFSRLTRPIPAIHSNDLSKGGQFDDQMTVEPLDAPCLGG